MSSRSSSARPGGQVLGTARLGTPAITASPVSAVRSTTRVAQRGTHLPGQHRPAAGEHGEDAGGGALPQQVQQPVDQAQGTGLLGGLLDALPAVDDEHHPRQRLLAPGGGAGALLAQVGRLLRRRAPPGAGRPPPAAGRPRAASARCRRGRRRRRRAGAPAPPRARRRRRARTPSRPSGPPTARARRGAARTSVVRPLRVPPTTASGPVGEQVPRGRAAPLPGRVVEQAVRQDQAGGGRWAAGRGRRSDGVRQRRQPRARRAPRRRPAPAPAGGAGQDVDEVGRGRCAASSRRRRRAAGSGSPARRPAQALHGTRAPVRRRAGPATRAVWSSTGASEPRRSRARPGAVTGSDAASGESTTSSESDGLLHAQRDPQVGVGLDLRAHHARRPLGGEHQVQPERAADGGEPHQPGDEVGQLLGQHAELVDHEHQAGQGGQVGPGGVAQRQVGVQVRRAGGAPARARGGATSAPSDSSARAVRAASRSVTRPTVCGQPGALRERRPALVVDQHERQLVRTVRQREPGHQGLEQLALAGAGGAGDQRVRAVAAQVDGDRPAGADAQDGGGAARLLVPAAQDGLRRERTVRGDQVEQAHLVGQPAAGLRRGVAQGREPAGEPVRPALGHEVGHDVVDRRAAGAGDPQPRGDLAAHQHRAAALDRQLRGVGVEADRGDADGGTVVEQPRHAGQGAQPLRAVEQDDDVASGEPAAAHRPPAGPAPAGRRAGRPARRPGGGAGRRRRRPAPRRRRRGRRRRRWDGCAAATPSRPSRRRA